MITNIVCNYDIDDGDADEMLMSVEVRFQSRQICQSEVEQFGNTELCFEVVAPGKVQKVSAGI